jgi:hypothetical protein
MVKFKLWYEQVAHLHVPRKSTYTRLKCTLKSLLGHSGHFFEKIIKNYIFFNNVLDDFNYNTNSRFILQLT